MCKGGIDNGGATFRPRCSQEHPDLKKKKKLYTIIKKYIFVYLKKKIEEHPQPKLGTPSTKNRFRAETKTLDFPYKIIKI